MFRSELAIKRLIFRLVNPSGRGIIACRGSLGDRGKPAWSDRVSRTRAVRAKEDGSGYTEACQNGQVSR